MGAGGNEERPFPREAGRQEAQTLAWGWGTQCGQCGQRGQPLPLTEDAAVTRHQLRVGGGLPRKGMFLSLNPCSNLPRTPRDASDDKTLGWAQDCAASYAPSPAQDETESGLCKGEEEGGAGRARGQKAPPGRGRGRRQPDRTVQQPDRTLF